MSQQSFFGTVSLNASTSSNIYVDLGFTPGRIELINLTKMQANPHVATVGWKAFWQTGMASGTAISTAFGASTTFYDVTSNVASAGITLLNPLGSEAGQYGAVVSGFTNANPGVLTVDSTANANIAAGCIIRVSLVADNQAGPTLNGDYYVTSVTPTTITVGTAPAGLWSQTTLNSLNTTSSGVYVSGGAVTLLQTASATTPNPPNTIYSNVPKWYNEAQQGFIIGTSVFPGATYSTSSPDIILVSAWDQMQP